MSKTYLESDEIALMENAATNLRDRLLVRLLFHLGCRVSEALAIEVDNVDLRAGTVTIQHLKVRTRLGCPKCGFRLSRSHVYCPGCGASVKDVITREHQQRRVRTLPLDKATLAMIQTFIQHGGPVKRGDRLLLFAVNRHRAWGIIRELAEKAGLPKLVNPETGRTHSVSPHRLRDAFAINAMKVDDSGDGMRLLQEQLGHTSFDTTARYRKVAGEELKKWYDRLWEGTRNGA